MAGVGRPQLRRRRAAGLVAGGDQLERAEDALRVGRADAAARPGSAACSSVEVGCARRAPRGSPGRPAGAGRGRRAPRAGTGRCRRRRSAAGRCASSASISAWARCGVGAGGERLGRSARSRSAGARARLLGASAAPVRIGRPCVDLQRVGETGDRVLAARAQPRRRARSRRRSCRRPVGPNTAIDAHRASRPTYRGACAQYRQSACPSASAPACRPSPDPRAAALEAAVAARARARRRTRATSRSCSSPARCSPRRRRCSRRSTRSSRRTG